MRLKLEHEGGAITIEPFLDLPMGQKVGPL